MRPVKTVKHTIMTMAGRISFNMSKSSRKACRGDGHVDQLDADEGHNNATEDVDEQIAHQQRGGAGGAVLHAPEGKRDQRDDDQRVEYDRRQDSALRRLQVHEVQRLEL